MELFYHERHMCIDNWHTLLPIEICKPTLLSDYLISIPFVFLDFNYKSNESGLKKKKKGLISQKSVPTGLCNS